MEDIQHALEANHVDGAVGVAAEVVANLEYAAAKALQRLSAGGMSPSCASNNACPISCRTAAGKSRKSCRLDPTKTAGLIA
jgi:hypothetical protein